jgi:hypothetical protein
MYHLLYQSVIYFVFVGFVCFSTQTEIISLNSTVNKLIVVMVKCCVLFEVRT